MYIVNYVDKIFDRLFLRDHISLLVSFFVFRGAFFSMLACTAVSCVVFPLVPV